MLATFNHAAGIFVSSATRRRSWDFTALANYGLRLTLNHVSVCSGFWFYYVLDFESAHIIHILIFHVSIPLSTYWATTVLAWINWRLACISGYILNSWSNFFLIMHWVIRCIISTWTLMILFEYIFDFPSIEQCIYDPLKTLPTLYHIKKQCSFVVSMVFNYILHKFFKISIGGHDYQDLVLDVQTHTLGAD